MRHVIKLFDWIYVSKDFSYTLLQINGNSYATGHISHMSQVKGKGCIFRLHCNVIIGRNPIEANANTGENPTGKSCSLYG